MSIHFWEVQQKKDLIKTGVAISKYISSQSGLPLLEKKFDLLSTQIEEIKKKPEVVFASIIDHKNKLIAYTDQDQFFTLSREKSGEQEGVQYWKISDSNHLKIMNFSSEITFSQTRIGEVFISLAVNDMGNPRRWFLFFAVLSVSAILSVFGLSRYQDGRLWWKTKQMPPREPPVENRENGYFNCPLCHGQTGFTTDLCKGKDLEAFLILKQFPSAKEDVLLKDLDRDEELAWLKKRIIARCASIITKISTE